MLDLLGECKHIQANRFIATQCLVYFPNGREPYISGLPVFWSYHVYIYNVGITCFTARTQCFQEFYMCTFQRCCACVRDVVHVSEMWCTCQRCCARFPAVVHVSQKLCTFHKPPNNVRVQLYTHWAHSNQQKHWGDQTRSSDMYIIYIYICMYIYAY